jgi:heterodisulfide reductase subunit C
MRREISAKGRQTAFLLAVEKMSGQNVSACSQCGRCSAGCPVLPDVDMSPNVVMRLTQLGLEQEALESEMLWSCAGCGTCTGRCPQGINIGRIMDTLRAMAERRGAVHARGALEVRTFYRAFLDCVREFGRNSEVGLMGGYNINSGRLMTNVAKAPWFILKSKISLKAHKVEKIDRMERVYARIKAIEDAEMETLFKEIS